MAHKFNIGRIVELEPGALRLSALGPTKSAISFLPQTETPAIECYRIKSIAEKHERVALENEFTLSRSAFA